MNKIIKIFTVLFIIAFMISSCKKDDDSGPKDRITYDGQSYSLVKGYVANLGAPVIKVTVNEFAIFMASSEVTMLTYDPPAGVGNWIGLWLLTTSETSIVPGTYTFSDVLAGLNTFNGEVMLESGYYPFKALPPTDIASGTLTIDINEDIYEISFEGTIVGGESLNAYYKGPLITILDI